MSIVTEHNKMIPTFVHVDLNQNFDLNLVWLHFCVRYIL